MSLLGAINETRFMNVNALEGAPVVTASSAAIGYPLTDGVDKSRSKLWIASGRFTIGTTNNKLYLKAASTTFTVTLDSGDYASPYLLAAHIKAKIIAVNAGWDVRYNRLSDSKFSIWYNGGFEVQLVNRTNAVWDTIGFTSTTTLVSALVVWFNASTVMIHTSERLSFDMGAGADVSFFAMQGEKGKVFPLSANAVVTVKASNINDYSTATLSEIITPGDYGIFAFFDAKYSPCTFRYFWIDIVDPNNVAGPALSFSQIFVGGFQSFNNRTVASGFSLKSIDRSTRKESLTGDLFFAKHGRYDFLDGLTLQSLLHDTLTSWKQYVFDVGLSEHFYMSLDSGNLNGDLADLTFYGVFDADPVVTFSPPQMYDVTFSFRGC